MLRKKPPPPTLPSAHAVEREFQVIHALGPTPVPVPRAVHLCEDSSVLGTPFYVMEHVHGRIFEDPALPEMTPSARTAIYAAMATTLARLHSVSPDAVGLGQYGSKTKYNARQVARWSRQYLSAASSGSTIAPMPEMMQLGDELQRRIPAATDADPSTTRICHGDFRLDNLVYDLHNDDCVLAVLDWELSTLGDPLADVAYNCLPYHLHECAASIPSLPALPLSLPPGIPTEHEYIEMYCKARGIQYPNPLYAGDWEFYLALALFRLASILAGVGARAKAGNASSRIAEEVGADASVRSLAVTALKILSKNTTTATASSSSSVLGLGPSQRVLPILERLKLFMKEKVMPAEPILNAHAASDARWTIHPLHEQLKREAKDVGLWNLWISADLAVKLKSLVVGEQQSHLIGPGLSNLEYAHCAEVMGRCVWASECFNCSAPDTGNMVSY